MFDDRSDAGQRLAAELDRRDVEADVVLAIPRGALPVARPVADRLDADLDVIVASKLGAPGNSELAIGAAGSDGAVWRNDELIEQLGVSEAHFERERERQADAARTKLERYRGTSDLPTIADRHVVVVDDGVATGATARACLRQIRERDPASVILAVPVSSPRSADELTDEADSVVALETPRTFRAVGQYYRQFGQVSDEEAMRYLE